MPIEVIGMIGVRPEGADGAAVHVIGGEIDAAWVRDFSRAHERGGSRVVPCSRTFATRSSHRAR